LRGANGRHYTGATEDLARRLSEHRRGETHTTARLGGALDLVASRQLGSMAKALALEKWLKKKKNPRLAVFNLSQGDGRPLT